MYKGKGFFGKKRRKILDYHGGEKICKWKEERAREHQETEKAWPCGEGGEGRDTQILEEQILITESGSVVIAQRNSFFIPHPASTLIQPSVKFTLLSVPADQIRASFKVALFYLGYA